LSLQDCQKIHRTGKQSQINGKKKEEKKNLLKKKKKKKKRRRRRRRRVQERDAENDEKNRKM
jgi:hypothetical protein